VDRKLPYTLDSIGELWYTYPCRKNHHKEVRMKSTERKSIEDHKVTDSDEDVSKMVREWDIVTCKICGRKLSMLDVVDFGGGQYFVCSRHK